jgi:hypothetical protein
MNFLFFVHVPVNHIGVAECAPAMRTKEQLLIFQQFQVLSNGYGRYIQVAAKVQNIHMPLRFQLCQYVLMPFR